MGGARPLDGKVAVVTGSTSGIGLALADALAQAGARVVLNGLGEPADIERTRAEVAARSGVEVGFHGADMRRPEQIADLVAQARAWFGRLDILVNNAGVQHVAPIEDFPTASWDLIMAVNLSSAFHTIRAAVPVMKAQGTGRIVNIASAHGLVASPFKSAYVSAKHGLIGLTKTAALELATFGVTCNAICPGYVRTPLVEAQIADTAKARGISEEAVVRDVMLGGQPTKRFVETGEIAAMLLYLVSDSAASVTGASLTIDGGMSVD